MFLLACHQWANHCSSTCFSFSQLCIKFWMFWKLIIGWIQISNFKICRIEFNSLSSQFLPQTGGSKGANQSTRDRLRGQSEWSKFYYNAEMDVHAWVRGIAKSNSQTWDHQHFVLQSYTLCRHVHMHMWKGQIKYTNLNFRPGARRNARIYWAQKCAWNWFRIIFLILEKNYNLL